MMVYLAMPWVGLRVYELEVLFEAIIRIFIEYYLKDCASHLKDLIVHSRRVI